MDDPGGVGSIALAGAQHFIPIRKKEPSTPYTDTKLFESNPLQFAPRYEKIKCYIWCVRWIHLSHKSSPHPLKFGKRCCPLYAFESQYRITVIKFDKSVHPYFCSNPIELRLSGRFKQSVLNRNRRQTLFSTLMTVRDHSNFTGYLRSKTKYSPLFF